MDDAELWGTLEGLNVTYLQRWGSAWADLQATGMALAERRELEATKATNVFLRRALWDSAVVSYGRFGFSEQARPISPEDFIEDVEGKDGLALHKRIMDWRHGHVAHRKRAEFESVETVLAYANGADRPTALRLVLGIDLGPLDDSDFVAAFQNHVAVLATAMYENKIRPLALSIIEDLNTKRIALPSSLSPARDHSTWERYVINQCVSMLGPGERS